MNESSAGTGHSLSIKREYGYPPSRVFEAWTNPEMIAVWMMPKPETKVLATVDLAIGGAYRLVFDNGDGDPFVVNGQYREIDPPQKLSFTWSWEGGIREPAETLVTVELAPTSSGTELTLTHECLSSGESVELHSTGWNGCLNGLQQYLD